MIVKPGFTCRVRMAKWAEYSRQMSLFTPLLSEEHQEKSPLLATNIAGVCSGSRLTKHFIMR